MGGEVGDRIIFASDRLDSDDLWRIAPNGTAYQDIHGRLVTPYAVFLPLVIK